MIHSDIPLQSEAHTVESIQAKAESHEQGFVHLTYQDATLDVSIHGAHVMSWIPSPETGEVFWTGGYETRPGKDCWGGVPLIWPWFIVGIEDEPKAPFHGLARFATWQLTEFHQSMDGEPTCATFELAGDLKTAQGSAVPLAAKLKIQLDDKLRLTLVTENVGSVPYRIEHGFHSYFKVGDVTKIRIDGLEGTEVQDNNLPGAPRSIQLTPVTIDGPAGRFYRPFPKSVRVEDPVLGRVITLRSDEASQLVLWNSGPVRTQNGNKTGEPDWQTQIALEPVNILEKHILLDPGETTQLSLLVETAPLNFSAQ